MKTKFFALVFSVLAMPVLAAGVAFVTNVTGDATMANTRVALMAELNKGVRINCTKDCLVGVMYLQSGKEYVLKGPGDYLIGETEATAKIGTPPAVRETKWRITDKTVSAAQTSSASVRMRSIGSGGGAPVKVEEKPLAVERLVYPLETSAASLQPTFRWASANEKGPFNFELSSATATKPLYKGKATATNLKLPANVKLQADTEYAWSVSAANSIVGKGSFHTLPVHSLELAQQRKPGDKAEFSDWLLYALTLQEVGATQDAKEILTRLATERPDLPELMALAK